MGRNEDAERELENRPAIAGRLTLGLVVYGSFWFALVCSFAKAVHPILRKFLQEHQECGIGPAETDYVLRISRVDPCLRGPGHDVVFLANSAVLAKIFRDGGQKFVEIRFGVIVEPVPS